ncbi:MAG: guanylate kinase [Chitinispirillales bacterium]|jgi:guanylate kinase|nr:guanylate kinase [Chitinispirillales bacterium]
MSKKGKVVIFSAASGAGKTTILNEIRKKMPQLVYSISATTREPRGNEKNGVDYFFMNKKDFIVQKDDNGFVEWAQVHGNYYGTPRDFIDKNLNENKIVVMDIDVQGKILLDKQYPENIIGIFIEAPSFEELETRLRKRASDTEECIKIRLKNAEKEKEIAVSQGKYNYFIVNENLDETVDKVFTILLSISKI